MNTNTSIYRRGSRSRGGHGDNSSALSSRALQQPSDPAGGAAQPGPAPQRPPVPPSGSSARPGTAAQPEPGTASSEYRDCERARKGMGNGRSLSLVLLSIDPCTSVCHSLPLGLISFTRLWAFPPVLS